MNVHAGVPSDPPDTIPAVFALGSEIAPDGAVVNKGDESTFGRGNEVYLSVDLSGASGPQDIDVMWQRRDGRTIRRDHRLVNRRSGREVFSSGPTSNWNAGLYEVSVAINGRDVTLKEFQIQ